MIVTTQRNRSGLHACVVVKIINRFHKLLLKKQEKVGPYREDLGVCNP